MKRFPFIIIFLWTLTACGSGTIAAPTIGLSSQGTQILNTTPKPTSVSALTFTPVSTATLPPTWCPVTTPGISASSGSISAVYVKDGNLWLATEGVEPRVLIQSGDVTNTYLSDDGQIIAYTRLADQTRRTVSLWRVRVSTGEVKELLSADQFSAMNNDPNVLGVLPTSITFNPNNHTIFFLASLIFETMNGSVTNGLWRVDADTGQYDLFMHQGMSYSFAPNGKGIALMNTGDFSLYTTDGKLFAQNLVPNYTGLGMGEYYAFPVFWSQDSMSLMVVIPADPADVFNPQATFTIWQITTADRQVTQLGTFHGDAWSVSFSGDLRFLSFTRWLDRENGLPTLILATPDGSAESSYAEDLTNSFGWRPGTYDFTYTSHGKIWLGNICNNPNVFLAGKIPAAAPSWLDSTRYYYVTQLETDPPTYDLTFVSVAPSASTLKATHDISSYSIQLITP